MSEVKSFHEVLTKKTFFSQKTTIYNMWYMYFSDIVHTFSSETGFDSHTNFYTKVNSGPHDKLVLKFGSLHEGRTTQGELLKYCKFGN